MVADITEVKNTKEELTGVKTIFHIQCYLTPNGLKTKKNIYNGKIENGRWIVFVMGFQLFPGNLLNFFKTYKRKISTDSYSTTTKDLVFMCETWCEKKNYTKSKQYCINLLKTNIHMAMDDILKEEKKLDDYKQKFDNYKKSVERFNLT